MPHLIVTASVDEIQQHRSLDLGGDVMLSGVVTWVGRSSMSIHMEAAQVARDGTLHPSPSLSVGASLNGHRVGVHQHPHRSLRAGVGGCKRFTRVCMFWLAQANFTFVARDPLSQKAALINPLQPTTDHERALWEEGERKAAARKAQHVAAKAGASESPEQKEVDTLLSP
jgi:acyl-coenzyme A thioesterase 9